MWPWRWGGFTEKRQEPRRTPWEQASYPRAGPLRTELFFKGRGGPTGTGSLVEEQCLGTTLVSPQSPFPSVVGTCMPDPSAAGALQCASGSWCRNKFSPCHPLGRAWCLGPSVPCATSQPSTRDPGGNQNPWAQPFCLQFPGGPPSSPAPPKTIPPISRPAWKRSGVDGPGDALPADAPGSPPLCLRTGCSEALVPLGMSLSSFHLGPAEGARGARVWDGGGPLGEDKVSRPGGWSSRKPGSPGL